MKNAEQILGAGTAFVDLIAFFRGIFGKIDGNLMDND
jgi:hypothetical protein